LFIVPKFLPDDHGGVGERNDIVLTGLNHKMGNRGTTNAVLSFGDGFLVAEEHRGLEYMFQMMNEARIGVGFLAVSLGYVGYLESLDYAKTRTQGRPLGVKDPLSPPVALIEHADVRRMLLAQKSYVEGAMALGLYCAHLVDLEATAETDADRAEATLLLDVLTPIAKSWPSQWCLEANSLAIQVLGGSGYTRDYNVEQYYRDNRLNPIHEGTHGIQGLDLLGRKVVMQGGAGLALLDSRVMGTVQHVAGTELQSYADALSAQFAELVSTTQKLWSTGDSGVALANSSVYLEAMGQIVIAWIWLEQLVVVGQKTGDFYDGKRAAARYFYTFELPKVSAQLALLASLDRTTLEMQPAWF
jgi:butyryl-CoA dehydrogenase